jgi:hypothetical protein
MTAKTRRGTRSGAATTETATNLTLLLIASSPITKACIWFAYMRDRTELFMHTRLVMMLEFPRPTSQENGGSQSFLHHAHSVAQQTPNKSLKGKRSFIISYTVIIFGIHLHGHYFLAATDVLCSVLSYSVYSVLDRWKHKTLIHYFAQLSILALY